MLHSALHLLLLKYLKNVVHPMNDCMCGHLLSFFLSDRAVCSTSVSNHLVLMAALYVHGDRRERGKKEMKWWRERKKCTCKCSEALRDTLWAYQTIQYVLFQYTYTFIKLFSVWAPKACLYAFSIFYICLKPIHLQSFWTDYIFCVNYNVGLFRQLQNSFQITAHVQ